MINHDTLWQPQAPAFGAPALGSADFGAAAGFAQPQPGFVPPATAPGVIYAFGDSLSDAGNDYVATGGVVPTRFIYSDGRFSNGNTWVQDLAQDLALPAVAPSLNGGTDYAYGGAETGQEPLHTVNPIDLPSQLAQFLVNVPNPSPDALYTLSIGANDAIDAIDADAKNPSGALKDIGTAVKNEVSFVAGLAADGARNFMILNVPDLGKTPELASLAAAATSLSRLYNAELSKELAALAGKDGLAIHIVDAFALIDKAVADPKAFGLKNVTTPVWTGNYENPLSGKLNATGSAQNAYLFFDHLHPTETGHLAIASLAMAQL